MSSCRVALATLRYPDSPEDAVQRVGRAIAEAGERHVDIVCFPEGYVPGYRGLGHAPPPPDPRWLEAAWDRVAQAAARARVAVVLGTERVPGPDQLVLAALVIDRDGARLGFQDKVQIDPSEDNIYKLAPGVERRVFVASGVTFGVVICHEGWRYPETTRAAVRAGAQIVFHPHLSVPEPGAFAPTSFANPRGSFHEKAVLCRAAENTCFFASVNYAVAGAPTTSAIAAPDGSLVAWQPYGVEGLLVADLDLAPATRLLATRLRA